MEHPFLPDLSGKTTEELQENISDLYKKLNMSARLNNPHVTNQMYMILEGYKKEYSKRMDEMFKKQNISNKINIE